MDVTNAVGTQVASAAPAVAKANASSSEAGKPAAVSQGNSLPDLGQVQVPNVVPTENPSDTNAIPQPDQKELVDLVDKANTALQAQLSDLKFTVAEGTDINIVRIEDQKTGELIRQFPSEAMVAIASALSDIQPGVMLEEEA